MIKLRLKRYGKKREASYRIIAINSLARRDGRPLEELGYYNPRTDEVRLDVPGIVKRLQQGAQPTDTVRRILQKAKMSLNRSVQKPLPKFVTKSPTVSPDYVGLVRFLMQPFLESPESLSVDCEMYHTHKRAWIRIAFESTDKGKVFGRGGRNIQAIRTVIAAAAEVAGHSVYLDIYGSNGLGRENTAFEEEAEERLPPPKSKERRVNSSRPIVKSRSR